MAHCNEIFVCISVDIWFDYGHLPTIFKTIQIRWTRHAGHWTCSSGPIHMDEQVLDDELELIYSGSVQTQDVA